MVIYVYIERCWGFVMKQVQQEKKSLFEIITKIYIAFMVSVFLMFPGFGGYEEITLQKWKLLIVISGTYLVVILLLRFELAIVGASKFPNVLKTWKSLHVQQKLIIGFWIFSAMSTIFSVNRSIAFWGSSRYEGLITLILYCGCFMLVSYYGKPEKWLLWLLGAAVSINCIVAIMQFAGYNPFELYPRGMNYYDANVLYAGEFLGTIGNIDILSAVLCVAIPAFWIAILKLNDIYRFFLLIPLVLCLAVLLKAFVAGGVVGVLGSALLSFPVMAKQKKTRIVLTVTIVFIIIVGTVMIYAIGSQMSGFLYEASELLHGRWNDDFGSGRLYIWRNVIELVPERLLLGGGPDTLGLRTSAAFERYDESLGVLIHSSIDTAHNEYLNILVNQGLIALLFYLTALIISAIQWVKEARNSSVTAICGGAVLGYCIQAFFGISSPISAPYFWIMLAFLLNSLPLLSKNKVAAKGENY